jgi:hydrogenase nickel incorporation protein HypA/HybF
MAVAQNIIQIVEDKFSETEQKGEIKKINIKVGKLTCVEPEALRLSFDVMCRDTILKKAVLEIDSVPITVECKDCRKKLTLDKMDFNCPNCGSFRIDVKTGDELFIESFEIE